MTTAALALVPPGALALATPFVPFCLGCGAKLPPLRAAAIGCPHCGAELVRADGTRATASRLAPWAHAAASLVLPGAGQALNGEPGKAVAVLLTCWLILPWLFGVVDAWRVARRRSLASIPRV
jgi:predicted RNA-binding Zn-ribbon protein involved in translation (DUF1610 family)